MRIWARHGDIEFSFERDPLPPERFKAVVVLLGAVLGVGGLYIVVKLCGLAGLAVAAVAGLIAGMMLSM